jgi:hypothetical protein
MSPHDHDGTGPKLTQEALAQVVRKTPERELTDEIKKRLGRTSTSTVTSSVTFTNPRRTHPRAWRTGSSRRNHP